MRTRIQRWGNSLGLRIPKLYAEEAQLKQHSEVDLIVENGRLVVMPCGPNHRLDDLLAGVTDQNLHGEQDFGEAAGREVW